MKFHILLSCLLGLLVISCSKNPNSPQFTVAEGKGFRITRGELNHERDAKLRMMNIPVEKLKPETLTSFDEQVLEQMILRQLLLNETKNHPASEWSGKVQEQIKKISDRMPKKEELEKMLSKAGLTIQDFQNDLRDQITAQTMIDMYALTDFKPVKEDEVKKFYDDHKEYWQKPETVKIRQVSVAIPPKATPDQVKTAMQKIDKAKARIAKGEDFEKVSNDLSDEKDEVTPDGQLVGFTHGERLPEIEKAAFSLPVGSVSGVIKTINGVHIIKVVERTKPRILSFDEVKGDIQNHLDMKKKDLLVNAYMKKLMDAAGVKTYLKTTKNA
jgi:parvulin-like peptidyl-prolyl isomerase